MRERATSPLVRLVLVAVGLVALAGVMRLLAPSPSPTVVTVGPDDSVHSEWVDGDPVWVVNDGGEVRVLEGLNPHPWYGLSELVGWCPSQRRFVAWWDRSSFDLQGRWQFGPAPRDLASYAVASHAPGVAQLGERVEPPGRSPPSGAATGAACSGDGDRGPAARYHALEGSRRAVFEGRMIMGQGVGRFCPSSAREPGCPVDGLDVLQLQPTGGMVVEGTFLANESDGALTDVIILPDE